MAERKLNFNAPLLSVRRNSARTASSNGEIGKKNGKSQRRLLSLPSCKADSSLDLVTEPVAVPFNWEQIPGKRKNGSKPDSHHHQEASVTPEFSPRTALVVVKQNSGKKPENQEKFRPQIEANAFGGTGHLNSSKAGVDSENDDDVYSDALDTLSATDSFSVHCSVSGLSGFGSLAIVKPSGTFATDPQVRDFMMSRFLPAAKAMTLEQPHYASKNKPVSGEQPIPMANVIQRDRKPQVVRNASLPIVPYHQDIEDEESEDGGDEYSDADNITTKGCGLLPRLCVKNSLGLSNPVPGIKVKAQNFVPGMKVKLQNSISKGSHGAKRIDKAAFARSQSPTIKRLTRDVLKPEMEDDVQSPRLARVVNNVACGSNRFSNAGDRQMISRTSPFRRSGVTSPCRNSAPQSPFRGQGFLGVSKEHEIFRNNKWTSNNKVYSKSHELVPYQSLRQGSRSRPMSPTVERTLYVDTVHAAGILSLNSGSSNAKKSSVSSTEKDLRMLIQSRRILETAASKNSLGTGKSPDKGQPKVEDLSQDLKALVCIDTGSSNDNVNTESDQMSKEDDAENAKTSLVVCPLPPPKTPSESWLWRTLPSISSHSPLYRGLSFQSKRQDPYVSSANTKWENIVKSSYLHHDHVRYSEELFPNASQRPNS